MERDKKGRMWDDLSEKEQNFWKKQKLEVDSRIEELLLLKGCYLEDKKSGGFPSLNSFYTDTFNSIMLKK